MPVLSAVWPSGFHFVSLFRQYSEARAGAALAIFFFSFVFGVAAARSPSVDSSMLTAAASSGSAVDEPLCKNCPGSLASLSIVSSMVSGGKFPVSFACAVGGGGAGSGSVYGAEFGFQTSVRPSVEVHIEVDPLE